MKRSVIVGSVCFLLGCAGVALAQSTGLRPEQFIALPWTWTAVQTVALNSLAGISGLTVSSTSTAAASNAQKLLDVELSGANATSTQTTYGAYVSNTHTGTSSTNVGLLATASGGSTNHAAEFPRGTVVIGSAAGGWSTLSFQGSGDSISGLIGRADGTQDLYFGAPSDSGKYFFRGTGVFNTTNPIVASGLTTGTSADYLCLDASNNVIVQTGVCVISSARFKRDVEPVRDRALDKVMALTPMHFRMDNEHQGHRGDVVREGLIAEDVALADPLLAVYGKDGLAQSWDEQGVIALLVKAVQEQQEEIVALKTAMKHTPK